MCTSEKQTYPSKQSQAEVSRAKAWAIKATAIAALGGAVFGMVEGARAMKNSEGFAAWNNGPTLSIRANTPATVIDHQHTTHDASYGKFSVPQGKYILELREPTAQKDTDKKWDVDWVQVSEGTYDHAQVGDSVEVEQLNPHWDNRLFAKEEYSVHELDNRG